jgi:hypothetical protein
VSIKPVSDILLDVARAADPVKSLMATERLTGLRSTEIGSNSGFATAIKATAAEGAVERAPTEPRDQLALMGATSPRTRAPVDARTKAYKGLEQLVLQSLVENMLPKDAGEIFGHGAAGDIWRSMLAEQLATQIGKNVDLGLVKAASIGGGAIAPSPESEGGARGINANDALVGLQS